MKHHHNDKNGNPATAQLDAVESLNHQEVRESGRTTSHWRRNTVERNIGRRCSDRLRIPSEATLAEIAVCQCTPGSQNRSGIDHCGTSAVEESESDPETTSVRSGHMAVNSESSRRQSNRIQKTKSGRRDCLPSLTYAVAAVLLYHKYLGDPHQL